MASLSQGRCGQSSVLPHSHVGVQTGSVGEQERGTLLIFRGPGPTAIRTDAPLDGPAPALPGISRGAPDGPQREAGESASLSEAKQL